MRASPLCLMLTVDETRSRCGRQGPRPDSAKKDRRLQRFCVFKCPQPRDKESQLAGSCLLAEYHWLRPACYLFERGIKAASEGIPGLSS